MRGSARLDAGAGANTGAAPRDSITQLGSQCVSTVPVGTGEWIRRTIEETASTGSDFEVASNPEFLQEGRAVRDTLAGRVKHGTDAVADPVRRRRLALPDRLDSLHHQANINRRDP
jgi:hypothetical protein